MSEIKPCPCCGTPAHMGAPNMHRKTNVICPSCGLSSGYGTPEEVTSRWNRRARPANEPLTLEQLREMEWYEPVYVKFKHAIPSKVVSNLYDCLCYIGASESNYGKTWLAYRRPPERSENE